MYWRLVSAVLRPSYYTGAWNGWYLHLDALDSDEGGVRRSAGVFLAMVSHLRKDAAVCLILWNVTATGFRGRRTGSHKRIHTLAAFASLQRLRTEPPLRLSWNGSLSREALLRSYTEAEVVMVLYSTAQSSAPPQTR